MVLAFLLKDMNELFNNIFQELHRGDTVYYVIGSGAMYSIKKLLLWISKSGDMARSFKAKRLPNTKCT